MADPTIYTPVFSFTGFQNNAPTTPLPAPALDNELLDVATSIATIVQSIRDVRRSDGALQNGVVTFDSLALAVQLMLDPTNATLVANAVAAAQASATSASGSASTATTQAAASLASAIAAAASASTVNLTLFLAKANNLAGLGSLATSRTNLGLGSSAVLDAGVGGLNVPQLDASGKMPAVDGSQLINTGPPGEVVFVQGTTALSGTVKLNGSVLSRASFPRLWSFAQSAANLVSEATWASNSMGAFSTGDLVTNFRVPDARGEFIRMFDDGRGVDAGRGINTNQADSLKSHTHTLNSGTAVVVGTTSTQFTGGPGFTTPTGAVSIGTVTSDASTGTASETRPRNIVMTACIRY